MLLSVSAPISLLVLAVLAGTPPERALRMRERFCIIFESPSYRNGLRVMGSVRRSTPIDQPTLRRSTPFRSPLAMASPSASTGQQFSAEEFFAQQPPPPRLEAILKGVEEFVERNINQGRRVVLVTVSPLPLL